MLLENDLVLAKQLDAGEMDIPQSSRPRPLARPWGGCWPVFGLTLLAAAARFYHLGAPALWTDEAFSVWMAKHSVPDIFRWAARIDAHPPLYYIVLHFWLAFGNHEGTLRALSALCGIVTVPLAYLLGRTLKGHGLGLLTALFLTLSPFNVWYDQEARMYPLLMLAATTAMLGLAILLRSPRSAAVPFSKGASFGPPGYPRRYGRNRASLLIGGAWLAYILGVATALWSQHAAIFLLMATNLIVLIVRSRLQLKGAFVRNWIAAQAVILALWGPALAMLVSQISAGNGAPQPVSIGHLQAALMADVMFSGSAGLLPGAAVYLVLILVCLGFWAWRRDRRWNLFTLSLWLLPGAAEVIASILWRPIFAIRTLMWTSIPLYLIMASGILQLRFLALQAVALASLLAMDLGTLSMYYAMSPKWEEWDRTADYIAKRVRAEDLILFNDALTQLPFDYYFQRYQRGIAEHGVPLDFPEGGTLEPKMTTRDLPGLETLVGAHKYVWLVYSHDWYTDPWALIPPALERLGRLADQRSFLGWPYIRVYLFEMNPSATQTGRHGLAGMSQATDSSEAGGGPLATNQRRLPGTPSSLSPLERRGP